MINLKEDSEFWYKLGVDHDKAKDQEGDLIKNLIQEFCKGKKSYMEKKLVDINSLFQLDEEKLKNMLRNISVEWLWDCKKSGVAFNCENKDVLNDEIKTSREERMIVENIGNHMIIWRIEPQIIVIANDDWKTIGRKILNAKSIIIKTENKGFEMRGDRSDLGFFKKKFEGCDGIKEVKLIKNSTSITNSLNKFLKIEHDDIEIIGVKFLESMLPKRSKILIKNDTSNVYPDLYELENKQVISLSSILQIKDIYIRFRQIGKIIKLRVKNLGDCFVFEIDDSKLLQEEREEAKKILESSLDISFKNKYDYDAQSDEKYIFTEILRGSSRVYKKYFDKLSTDIKDILQNLIEIKKYEENRCKNCKYEFQGDVCPVCGSEDYIKVNDILPVIKEDSLIDLTYSLLSKIISKKDKISNSEVDYEQLKLHKKDKCITLEFTRTQYSESRTKSFMIPKKLLFYIVPSPIRKPNKIEGYLRLFKNVEIYDFIKVKGDKPQTENLIINLIESSLKELDDRIAYFSTEARNRLSNLENIKKYSPKDFERDVFYIFKRLFTLSERLGRERKKESDGILIIGLENDKYFVASYDPKLTVKKEFYELSSDESSKAMFYILSENDNADIKILTNEEGIKTHVIVSNKFDTKNIKNFVKNINDWYELIKGKRTKVSKTPIMFIELKTLIELYDIYKENSSLIRGHVDVFREFMKVIVELFNTTEEYKMIQNKDIELLKTRIIDIRNQVKYKSPIF